jgi:hypothetical protein
MEILCLVMSNLFEHSHQKFKLVLGHDDGSREVGLFSFSLGATLRVTGPRGNGPLGTCALPASLLVVLIQPLLIALVHVVNQPIVKPVGDGLFDSA